MARPDPFPAAVCAVMALGLALGPALPRAMGYPEAIWGRGASLAAASLPLILLLLPRGAASRRAWLEFAGKAGLVATIAGLAFLEQWFTPELASLAEVAWAKTVYASAYIGLQALLALAWWRAAEAQVLRDPQGRTPYVPLLGAFLAVVGAGMALIVQVLLADPHLTGPWQVPLAPQKDVQIGDIGLAMLRIGMLVAALVPLAWWGWLRAREMVRVGA